MDCLRLARGTKDYLNTALFLHEFYPSKDEFMRVFCDEVSGPKEVMQKLYEISQKRFLEVHGLDFALSPDEPDRDVLIISVSDLNAEFDQLEHSIADIIPAEGGIMWRWYSNADRLDNKLPNELINTMTRGALIQRTKRDLSDQFTYTFSKVVDGELAFYFATFRRAFAMLGFVEMMRRFSRPKNNRESCDRFSRNDNQCHSRPGNVGCVVRLSRSSKLTSSPALFLRS